MVSAVAKLNFEMPIGLLTAFSLSFLLIDDKERKKKDRSQSSNHNNMSITSFNETPFMKLSAK